MLTFLLLKVNIISKACYLHKIFILAYGSRRINSDGGDIAARGGHSGRNGERRSYTFKYKHSGMLPPAMSHLLSLPRQHHQLGTKYSDTLACGRQFSFNTSQRPSIKHS